MEDVSKEMQYLIDEEVAKQRIEDIMKLKDLMKWTNQQAKQAMDALNVPEAQQREYAAIM